MVNENQLKGKYVAKGYTQNQIAQLLGISPVSLRAKLKNRKDFKGTEIQKLIDILDIPDAEIGPLFFRS